MSQETIYQNGTAEVNVPATESIAISNYGGGIAKIYYHIITANTPPAWQFQQTLENSAVILGPFAVATIVRIDANNSKVFYDIGSSPDTGIGDADTLNGKASDTASTADTIVARDSSGNITGNVLISDVAIGTAPLSVTSTTVVPNLNADTVDGVEGANIAKLNAINVFSAARNEFTGEIDLYVQQYLRGQDSGGTPRDIAVVLSSNTTQFGNTALPTIIQSNGTFMHGSDIIWTAGNDSGLVHIAGTETITGQKLFGDANTYFGINATGDVALNLADVNSGAYRSLKWSNANNDWYAEDNTNTDRLLYHSGNDTNLAKLNAANTFTLDQKISNGAGDSNLTLDSSSTSTDDNIYFQAGGSTKGFINYNNDATPASEILNFYVGGTGAGNIVLSLTGSGIANFIDLNISGIATYADNAAAITGGLATGDVYKTATGALMIVY